MNESDEQRDAMRAFLGKLAAEVLGWKYVRGVYVRLETSYRFEDNGWDGYVQVSLDGERSCGCMFASYTLNGLGDHDALISRFRRVYEAEINKRYDALVNIIRTA